MISHKILSKYFAKIYIQQLFVVSIVVFVILIIANAFDTIHKFKILSLAPYNFWQLILLKIPYLFIEVSSLCCFISTMLFLQNINRSNELIVAVSSGIAVWRIFVIPILVTLFFGIIVVTIINPISTYGLKKYKKLETVLNNKPRSNFIISQASIGGIFFFEKFAGDDRIIQVRLIDSKEKKLSDITVLMLDSKNNLIKRIDAPLAFIKPGIFILHDPVITIGDNTEKKDQINLPTNLSINNLMQSFVSPEMISIWSMKKAIENFSKSGLYITKYQIYYYKQLFKPIFMVAMSCIACWFISLNIKTNSSRRKFFIGLVLGGGGYFLFEMVIKILAYSGINPIIAVLSPVLFIILLSVFVILHFQDA